MFPGHWGLKDKLAQVVTIELFNVYGQIFYFKHFLFSSPLSQISSLPLLFSSPLFSSLRFSPPLHSVLLSYPILSSLLFSLSSPRLASPLSPLLFSSLLFSSLLSSLSFLHSPSPFSSLQFTLFFTSRLLHLFTHNKENIVRTTSLHNAGNSGNSSLCSVRCVSGNLRISDGSISNHTLVPILPTLICNSSSFYTPSPPTYPVGRKPCLPSQSFLLLVLHDAWVAVSLREAAADRCSGAHSCCALELRPVKSHVRRLTSCIEIFKFCSVVISPTSNMILFIICIFQHYDCLAAGPHKCLLHMCSSQSGIRRTT